MKLENDTKSVENSQRGDDNPKQKDDKGWRKVRWTPNYQFWDYLKV